MHPKFPRPLLITLLIVPFILANCSVSSLPPNSLDQPAGKIQPSSTPTPEKSATKRQVAAVLPSSTPEYLTQDPSINSYHTVLITERSADLILALIAKMQAGQITGSDISAIAAYTSAFNVAVDLYNRTTPPVGMGDIWNQLFTSLTVYGKAYGVLIRGSQISSYDSDILIKTRQNLAFSQHLIETYLERLGYKQDSFPNHLDMVNQLLQQLYGPLPVPKLP